MERGRRGEIPFMRNSVVEEALDDLSRGVIGAAIEVHRCIGAGFPESVYEKALCVELEIRGIPFACQAPVKVNYKGRVVGEGRMDILVDSALVVELKAVDTLLPVHSAQLVSYLRAAGVTLGLLINFNVQVLTEGGIKRKVYIS